jgi:hypothetical protein
MTHEAVAAWETRNPTVLHYRARLWEKGAPLGRQEDGASRLRPTPRETLPTQPMDSKQVGELT